jgi:ribosome-binding factor A
VTEGVRPERVGEAFKEVLAEEIPRLKDPRVGFVTVTQVSVTPDLRRAHVYYTVLGEESATRATHAGLRSARGHLRAALGRKIRLKFLPEIEFHRDEGIVQANRVDELLRELGASEGDD